MMKWLKHKWSNLRNNEDNKANMREFFDGSWDEALATILALIVMILACVTLIKLQGV